RKRNSSLVESSCAEDVTGLKLHTEAAGAYDPPKLIRLSAKRRQSALPSRVGPVHLCKPVDEAAPSVLRFGRMSFGDRMRSRRAFCRPVKENRKVLWRHQKCEC